MMTTSFSAYSGPEFLLFYVALMAAAVIAGIWMPMFLRADGREQTVSDVDELAWLASGPARFTESVIARLYAIGALAEASDNKLTVIRRDAGATPAEWALTAIPGTFGLTEAHRTLKPYAEAVENELVRRELLLESGKGWSLRLIGAAPYLIVLLVGWYRREAGAALGEPTGFLTVLMIVTAVLALFRLFKFDPRTRAGQDAVARAREGAQRLESAPTEPELGLGVALFGTAILAGTPYEQLHAMRRNANGDGGGDSGSDGGGDGGGGCGGCGG